MMEPQVHDRHIDLLRSADDALGQVLYEGSHAVRQDPEPSADSPWDRPDLPMDVLLAIQEARNALWRASDLATSHMRKQAVS